MAQVRSRRKLDDWYDWLNEVEYIPKPKVTVAFRFFKERVNKIYKRNFNKIKKPEGEGDKI